LPLTETELGRLRAAGEVLRKGLVSPVTILGYTYDWAMFTAWSSAAGRQSLPASAETVSLYLTDLLEQGKKITTARRRKCAIVYEHRARGFASPATAEVTQLLTGAQRIRAEKPRQMRALTVKQLRAMSIDLEKLGTDVAIRNRAILVVGFASALRRSNLAALNLDDVEFCAKGLILSVNREKNDPEAKGRLLAIPRGKHANTCPVRTLRAWLRRRGGAHGPLFPRLDPKHEGQRMDGECIWRVVKKCVARIGIDPADRWGAHSMRAGMISAAGEADVGVLRIGAYTNQSPEIVRRYFRRQELWRNNPCAQLGL